MIEIIDCDQNSEAWRAARLGIPTASQFSAVLAKGEGKVRRSYMLKLAAERYTGVPTEGYTNAHMERGHIMEGEARDLYAFARDVEPIQVGFIRNGQKGASPDSLIGDVGLLEVKTKLPEILADVILRDRLPPEHKAQCQGALWVCEREWLDFVAFWPLMPLFVHRVYRDEEYIKTLADEVDRFNAELDEAVEKLKRYGAAA